MVKLRPFYYYLFANKMGTSCLTDCCEDMKMLMEALLKHHPARDLGIHQATLFTSWFVDKAFGADLP